MRGGPLEGRELMGRALLGPDGRPVLLGIGRRAPGGGGIGRPVALMGRPGGGGIGRPVALMGGRVEGDEPSAPGSEPTTRCVGRIVTGPSGEAVRVGTGLGGATLLRTTLGAGASTTGGAVATALGGVLAVGGVGAPFLFGTLIETGRGRDRGLGGASRLHRLDGLRGLGGLGRGFGLHFSAQPISVGPASNAVGLGILDGRRGARGPDT